jgi:sec-independent protein translocase protein TatA
MGDLISPVHIILLLIVALLVFGPKKLPEIGAGLGRSIREFKQAMNATEPPPEATPSTDTPMALKEGPSRPDE